MSRSRYVNSYYDLLGVPPHATELEIRSAYGRDVLKLQETASDKVAQFRAALDAAFATLVDPVKRSEYDETLAAKMGPERLEAILNGDSYAGDCATRAQEIIASCRAFLHSDATSALAAEVERRHRRGLGQPVPLEDEAAVCGLEGVQHLDRQLRRIDGGQSIRH